VAHFFRKKSSSSWDDLIWCFLFCLPIHFWRLRSHPPSLSTSLLPLAPPLFLLLAARETTWDPWVCTIESPESPIPEKVWWRVCFIFYGPSPMTRSSTRAPDFWDVHLFCGVHKHKQLCSHCCFCQSKKSPPIFAFSKKNLINELINYFINEFIH